MVKSKGLATSIIIFPAKSVLASSNASNANLPLVALKIISPKPDAAANVP